MSQHSDDKEPTDGQSADVSGRWSAVGPISDTDVRRIQSLYTLCDTTAMSGFYDELFARRPDLRSMFPGDLHLQQFKVRQVISVIVDDLDRLDALIPNLKDLGRRHANFGVTARDYDAVGEALIAILARGHGSVWTAALEQAWRRAYGMIARTMIDAADARTVTLPPARTLAPSRRKPLTAEHNF